MINLNNITLLEVNCVNPELGVKSLIYSMRGINFAKSIIFSHYKPINLPTNIEYIEIPKLNYDGFSKFCIEELTKYVETDFALSINDDGFVINPNLWTDEFLNYDYIGAPWAPNSEWCPKNRVGNGGFCLKSKKFMDISSTIEYKGGHDDVVVTNQYYDYFIKFGIKYAPVDVAMKFSLEMKIPECEYNLDNCFGFHGKGIGWYHFGDGEQFKQKNRLLNEVL